MKPQRLLSEGLIRDDTPRGVWGISDAGRKALKAQGKVAPESNTPNREITTRSN